MKTKKLSLFLIALMISAISFGQPTGYYNGTEGLTGDDLKTALNEIIDDHVQFSYYASKTIFKLSDADPNNPDNVIQVYTGFSHPNNDYGNNDLELNREHVWAKSHGTFADIMPMYGDVHNLKPSAATVNQDKSNLDFDNGGTQHDIATGCYYTDSSWEARDEVKGDIARIIFYMDTRYEGNNGESNLTVVDEVNTSPAPEHGRLSTLLEWNEMDPPDEFERNRNNVIFSWQKNRNPFIDNPEFANLIWNNGQVSPISFSNFENIPENPIENEIVSVNASVTSSQGAISEITLHWGLSHENLTNVIDMESSGGDDYTADIPGQNGAETVYFQIVASDGTNTSSSIIYNYYVSPVFNGTITTIYDIQGQAPSSPLEGQIVSTTGVVTANFGDSYFMQDGYGEWNGLFIWDGGRNPSIGDSVVLTGLVEEYENINYPGEKTELKNISAFYHISSNNVLPEAILIGTGQASESYESVLVTVNNAVCTDPNYQSDYYMWKVDDGSGILKIHNTSIFEYEPNLNETYDITGPLNYSYGEWKIELRFENDVLPGTDLIPPTVSDVTAVTYTTVKVEFSEDIEEISAQTLTNYSINNDVVVQEANRHAIQHSIVFLTVSNLPSADFILTLNNIEDMSGNVMEETEVGFAYTGISDQYSAANISVYPNPANETLFINASETMAKVNIVNQMGETVMHQNISNRNDINLDVSDLTSGLYLLQIVFSDNTIKTYKIGIK